MHQVTLPPDSAKSSAAPPAVFAMSLGIFALVGAELLPASMLTLIAGDLHISQGLAGQAVTATALAAVASSLSLSVIVGQRDRRSVLLTLLGLLVAANLIAALAPNFAWLLLGRVLLGVAVGGFWALSAATILRLVAQARVPAAMAILFAGVSAATLFAAPFGSWFGGLQGWRAVFLVASAVGALAFVALWLSLPAMPAQDRTGRAGVVALLRRSGIATGILGLLLVFAGHFAFFTYLRGFLETVTGAGPAAVTALLFLFGAAGLIGNSLSARLIGYSMRLALVGMPLVLAGLALWLVLFGGTLAGDGLMILIWGVVFGVVPVSWSTWITRAAPRDAEAGGGLVVAASSLAISAGAGFGGVIIDLAGTQMWLICCAVVLIAAMAVAARLRV